MKVYHPIFICKGKRINQLFNLFLFGGLLLPISSMQTVKSLSMVKEITPFSEAQTTQNLSAAMS